MAGRRIFRYSLRGMLAAVAVAAVIVSKLAVPVYREWHDGADVAARTPRLVEKIFLLGGAVLSGDDCEVTHLGMTLAPTRWTESSARFLGVDRRREPIVVWLPDADPDRELLKEIVGSWRLLGIDLSNSRIDDEGLAHLERANTLEFLSLDGRHLTSVGLERLATLTRLRRLCLTGIDLSNGKMRYLLALKELRFLWLKGSEITDAEAARLSALPRLEYLNVSSTGVTDAFADAVLGFPCLRELCVADTRVSETAAERLHSSRGILVKRADDEEAIHFPGDEAARDAFAASIQVIDTQPPPIDVGGD